MIIDIILLVVAIFALVMGWRRGFVVQLCQLIGLYFAILIAPEFAGTVGANFSNDPGVAYIIGFAIIILCAWLLIWIVAPLLRKILFWEILRKIDSILGLASRCCEREKKHPEGKYYRSFAHGNYNLWWQRYE